MTARRVGRSGVPAPVVADGGAGGDIPQGDDAGLPGKHGTHGQDGFGGCRVPSTAQFAVQIVAVEREAGADHVVPGFRAGDGGGGVGEVAIAGMKSGGGQQCDGTLEIGALRAATGESRTSDSERWLKTPCNSTTGEAAMRAASAGSSASETPRRAMPVSTLRCTGTLRREAERGGGAFEGFDVFERWRWPGVRSWRSSGFLFAAPEAGHDQDGQGHAGFAHGDSLFGGGYAEPDGSGVFQGAGGFDDAVSVGVALDDAAGSDAGAEMAGDDAIVFSQRGERNFRPVGTGVHGEFLLCG